MAVKLELYRVFQEVARMGNISAAAQNLFISQSAVSQSIKQLEEQLQVRLFSRSTRGVVLTSEGKLLLDYVSHGLGLIPVSYTHLIGKRRGRACPHRLFCGHQFGNGFQNMIGRFLVPVSYTHLFAIVINSSTDVNPRAMASPYRACSIARKSAYSVFVQSMILRSGFVRINSRWSYTRF